MEQHLNRIELKGRLGSIKFNEVNGNKVANFSVITEILYKTREGQIISEATWFNVTLWDSKDAPDFNKFAKGMPIHVIGRMRTYKYTSAEGGEKTFYEVLASKVRFPEAEEFENI